MVKRQHGAVWSAAAEELSCEWWPRTGPSFLTECTDGTLQNQGPCKVAPSSGPWRRLVLVLPDLGSEEKWRGPVGEVLVKGGAHFIGGSAEEYAEEYAKEYAEEQAEEQAKEQAK